MRTYFAILQCRFSALLQYRAAAFAGLVTQIFWGLVKVMVMTAFFAESSTSQPLTLAQAVAFIWLGQSLLQLLPWTIDKEVEEQVRTGNVAYELVRPLDIYWLWYARSMAMRLVPTLLRAIPLFICGGLFFGLSAPVSVKALAGFVISLIGSLGLASSITTLVIVTLFWTISGEGIKRLLPHIVVLLSGMIIPLPLYPDWMQPFLNVQPFRGIIDIPCRIYLGIIPAEQSWAYIGFQMMWTALFILAGRFLLKKALRQFVVEGG